MQRLPVEYTEDARADMDAIFDHVLTKSRDVVTAMRYTDRIFARCEKIGDAPRGGVQRNDLGSGIRLVPFEDSAVILYRLEENAVCIVNVFAAGRDYEAILRGRGTAADE